MSRMRPEVAGRVYDVIREDVRARARRRRPPSRLSLFGLDLNLDDDWATPRIRTALYEGRYEHREVAVVSATLRPGDTYLEIGAGIGVVGSIACGIVGSESVHLYEANPELVRVIRATTATNGFSPSVVNAVLGRGTGAVDFYVHPDFWSSSLEPVDGARRVEVPKLDLHEELDRVRPGYLQIDIEGGEYDLLHGETLPAHVHSICLELHPGVLGRAAVGELLLELAQQGFLLDVELSGELVVFLTRR